jgi:hypothetical protein
MTDASGRRLQRAPRLSPARPRPAAAEEVLGAEHPLARAEHRVRWLAHQAATLAALLPVGALALLAGAPVLSAALLAGGLVEAWLLVALSAAAGVVRDRALDLIVEGRGSLPLASVRRRRAGLMRPRHVRRLAEAIEALRREARCPDRRHPSARPLYMPAVIRGVDAELAAAVRVLRAQSDATTIGRIERLLGGATSPLYGDDPKRLREELACIHFGAADANHRASSARERTPYLR